MLEAKLCLKFGAPNALEAIISTLENFFLPFFCDCFLIVVEHCETSQRNEFTNNINTKPPLFLVCLASQHPVYCFQKENMLPRDPTSNSTSGYKLTTLNHRFAFSSSIFSLPWTLLPLGCLSNRPDGQPDILAMQVVNLKQEMPPPLQKRWSCFHDLRYPELQLAGAHSSGFYFSPYTI